MSDPSNQVRGLEVVLPALIDRAVWRQSLGAWWVKTEYGIWVREQEEEVGTTIFDELLKWDQNKTNNTLVSNVQALAKYRLQKSEAVFDVEPWVLGTKNGILDLRSQSLTDDDDAGRYITKMTACGYVPDAVSPEWVAHMDMTFDGDEEVIHTFQKLVGAALVGDAQTEKPQFFVCLVGPEGGGKGLTTQTLRWVLGDYAVSLVAGDFSDDGSGSRHLQWMMRLRGARLAFIEEMKTQRIDVSMVKALSGGDSVVAHEMRQGDREWVPSHTLFFLTNTEIDFGSDGAGMRRRYVPLRTGPTRDDPTGDYAKRLRDNPEGIFAWAVAGNRMWQEEDNGGNIALPESVTNMRDSHVAAAHPWTQFVNDYLQFASDDPDIDPDTYRAHKNAVRAAYGRWIVENDPRRTGTIDDIKASLFYTSIGMHKDVQTKQVTIAGVGQSPGWVGVRLIERDEHGNVIG